MVKKIEYTSDHSFRYFRNSNILRVYYNGQEVDSCIPEIPLFAMPIYELTDDELIELGIDRTENQDLLIVKI